MVLKGDHKIIKIRLKTFTRFKHLKLNKENRRFSLTCLFSVLFPRSMQAPSPVFRFQAQRVPFTKAMERGH